MALLGVALPRLAGPQVAIDLYPEPPKIKKAARSIASPKFQEFLIVQLPPLDQRGLWESFQRVLRVTDADCWDINRRQELLSVSPEKITPPRNYFLYKAHFWPLDDLTADAAVIDFNNLLGEELDVEDKGFLLRLSFSVYRLFEQLMVNLSEYSAVIRGQVSNSRFLPSSETPELDLYKNFLSQIGTEAGDL